MENQAFYELLKNSTQKYQHKNALFYENHRFTYQEVLAKTDRLASALHNLGVKKHDVVTICMPNTPEAVYAFYALSKLGAICYEIHPKTSATVMARCMRETSSHLLIVLNIFANQYESLIDDLNIKIITCNPFEKYHMIKRIFCHHKSNLKNPGFIPYTKLKPTSLIQPDYLTPTETSIYLNSGGTSGEPKIIELSSKAVNSLSKEGTKILGITNPIGVYMLGVLPMFHGFGLCMGINSPIMYGACVTLMTKFNPLKTINLIKKKRCTIIIGVPGLFNALLHQAKFYSPKLKNLQVAYVGGDFVPADLTNRFNETMIKFNSKARLYEGYGLTETVTVCSVNTDASHKAFSVGKAISDLKIRIVDLKTHESLPPYTEGEICLSGSALMNGYLHDEQLTKQTFLCDDDGTKWVLTGDYGYLDDEQFLFFKQRLKRIIKVSGIIICPSDVENAVHKINDVYEVYATDVKNEERGSMIKLFITKNKQSKLTEKEINHKINNIIKEEVSVYALPQNIVYLEKMPKTDVGKIDSKVLESIK